MAENGNLSPQSQLLRDWAGAEQLVRRLAGEAVHREAQCGVLPYVKHPAILVQVALRETFRPKSPLESFSDAQPRLKPQTAEEEKLIPIDELLGQYDYKKQSIEIFTKNITHFAKSELNYAEGQQTDWKPFLRLRLRAFKSLLSESHEFIAQLISWMVLGVVEPLSER